MNSRLIIAAALAVVILVAGGAVALLAVSHSKPATSSAHTATARLLPTKSPSPNLAGVDCGKVTMGAPGVPPSFGGCFNQHRTACQPAHIVVDNEGSTTKGTVQTYAILSKKADSCLVKWSYLKLPYNTAWQRKDITCPYRLGSDFQKSLEAKTNFIGCSGPLLAEISKSATNVPHAASHLSIPRTPQPAAPR